MSPLKLALLSLFRHRFSTVISVVAIGIAVACAGILLRLYQVSEARFSVLGHGGDAVIGAKAGGIEILLNSLNAEGEFPDFLPYKLFQSLQAEQTIQHGDGTLTSPSYISSIIPFVYFGKLDNFRVVGTDETFLKRPRPDDSLVIIDGKWAQKGEVVLGSAVAKNKGLKVGDSVIINPWLGKAKLVGIEFKVAGVLGPTESVWDRTLFSTVEQAHQVFAAHFSEISEMSIWGPDVLHYFLTYLRPNGFAPLEALVNRRTVGQVVKIEEQKERLKELSGVGKKVGLFVTIFVLFLGGLSVCSMLVTRFEGMSLQLAVLRAVGYTKKELSRWLLWESFLLGVLGVFIGAIIDLMAFPVMRNLLGSALPPAELVSSSITNSAIIWFVAIAATVLSVLLPMWRLSRQDAHSFLKGL